MRFPQLSSTKMEILLPNNENNPINSNRFLRETTIPNITVNPIIQYKIIYNK